MLTHPDPGTNSKRRWYRFQKPLYRFKTPRYKPRFNAWILDLTQGLMARCTLLPLQHHCSLGGHGHVDRLRWHLDTVEFHHLPPGVRAEV